MTSGAQSRAGSLAGIWKFTLMSALGRCGVIPHQKPPTLRVPWHLAVERVRVESTVFGQLVGPCVAWRKTLGFGFTRCAAPPLSASLFTRRRSSFPALPRRRSFEVSSSACYFMSIASSPVQTSDAERELGPGSRGSVAQGCRSEQPGSPSLEEVAVVEVPGVSDHRLQRRTLLVDSLIRECKCDLSSDEFLRAMRYAGPLVTVRRPSSDESVFDAPPGYF
ncbi:unnamed protein product, partial [Cuscuta campestris]